MLLHYPLCPHYSTPLHSTFPSPPPHFFILYPLFFTLYPSSSALLFLSLPLLFYSTLYRCDFFCLTDSASSEPPHTGLATRLEKSQILSKLKTLMICPEHIDDVTRVTTNERKRFMIVRTSVELLNEGVTSLLLGIFLCTHFSIY